tara:strand:- start:9 stop:425 length:417 start_codon:yes stop_codon:yes gene_type:complete
MRIDKEQFKITHHKIGTKEDKLYTSLHKAKELDSEGYPITDSIEEAYAKATCNKKTKHIIDRKKNYSYYIKCNPNQEAFDTRELHSSLKDKSLNNFIDSTCKNEWKFREVDQNIFNKYISFLRNESVVLLKDINRSLK